ncbi:O-antigen ligase [Kistimonas scapharcae]|uniref:O-antigen ligase n=1 Tax=Kistimonas scapharcae TaxID=1036133 RepID=A0ABP8UYS0_9GAMM
MIGAANSWWRTLMTDTRYSRFLFYCLLLILLWLPLPFGSKPEWAMGLFQLLVCLLAGLWLVGLAFGKVALTEGFNRGRPVLLALSLVTVWLLVQSIPLPAGWVSQLSPVAYDAHARAASALGVWLPPDIPLSLDAFANRVHALLTLAYTLLFALTLLLVTDQHRMKWLAWAIVTGGAFQAFYGVISTLSGLEWSFFMPKEAGRGVATGTFVNRNSFAGQLEMTLAIGIGLLISQLQEHRARDRLEWLRNTLKTLMSSKVLLRAILAAMVIGLVMSRSRMGNTAFFSSLLVTGCLYAICRKKLSRGMIVLFLSIIVIDTVIVSQWFGLEKVVERIEQTRMDKELRADVNPVSLEIIGDFALTGSGAGTFYTTLPAYHDGTWRGFFDLAHNDYLQFPLEFGIPAFLLLAFSVVFGLWQAVRAMQERRNRLYIGMGFGSAMGVVALLIHSAVDFNLQIPANAGLFVVLLAIGVLARHLPTRMNGGGGAVRHR